MSVQNLNIKFYEKLKEIGISEEDFHDIFSDTNTINLLQKRIIRICNKLNDEIFDDDFLKYNPDFSTKNVDIDNQGKEIIYTLSSLALPGLKYIHIKFYLYNSGEFSAECHYDIISNSYDLKFNKSKIHRITFRHMVQHIFIEIANDIEYNLRRELIVRNRENKWLASDKIKLDPEE